MAETDGAMGAQLSDQLTTVHRLVHHGVQVTARQIDGALLQAYPEVAQAVREVQQRLAHQDADLEQRLECLGHDPEPAPASAELPPASVERAADAIEGDQAYLQHLSLEYQRLESACRPAGDTETADLAGRGYADTQYLLREQLSRAAPRAARADRPQPSMNPPGVV